MPKQNVYERLAVDLGQWKDKTVDRLAVDLRGGQNPPWKRAVLPGQKPDYWRWLPEDKKWQAWNSATPEEQDEIRELERLGGQYGRGQGEQEPGL